MTLRLSTVRLKKWNDSGIWLVAMDRGVRKSPASRYGKQAHVRSNVEYCLDVLDFPKPIAIVDNDFAELVFLSWPFSSRKVERNASAVKLDMVELE